MFELDAERRAMEKFNKLGYTYYKLPNGQVELYMKSPDDVEEEDGPIWGTNHIHVTKLGQFEEVRPSGQLIRTFSSVEEAINYVVRHEDIT